MKKSFLAAYGKRQYDTLVEMFQIRMRQGETANAFANRFRGMLPTSIKADHQLAKFWFLNKLPSKLRTRKAIQIFEKEGTFEDLREECHEAYQQALSDRSSKKLFNKPSNPSLTLSLFSILPQPHKSSSTQREDEQQPWEPVAFYSKSLNAAQRKYSTYDRE